MIKKENRLKKNKHFNIIYKHGDSVKSKYITLVFIKAKIKPFKVGFSVNNKIGKSVVRSKVKRRMRASFNQIYTLIDRRFNYIFVAREGIENLEQIDIKNEMLLVIKKAGFINEGF